jgi:hypothetical protein
MLLTCYSVLSRSSGERMRCETTVQFRRGESLKPSGRSVGFALLLDRHPM